MKAETGRLESLARAVASATPDFDEAHQRTAIAVYRTLADGRPVGMSEVARRAGVPAADVVRLLHAWPGVFLDADDRVVGFWGLTIQRLIPTHQLRLDGGDLFAWCAWDTLFLPEVLDRTLRVDSTCPTTRETISLVVSPDGIVDSTHPDAVVSFLRPRGEFDSDVVQSFCHFVHFFTSPGAGEAWADRHEGVFLLSLQEAFELGRLVNRLNFPSFFGETR